MSWFHSHKLPATTADTEDGTLQTLDDDAEEEL